MAGGGLVRRFAVLYYSTMLKILRRGLIGVLALMLVASGVFARQCAALAASGATPVAEQTASHAEHSAEHHVSRGNSQTDVSSSTSAHDHAPGVMHGHAGHDASDNPSPDSLIGKICGKNCGLCTLAGTAAFDAPMPGIFAFDSASYVLRTDPVSGHLVLVDPGIPKRIS